MDSRPRSENYGTARRWSILPISDGGVPGYGGHSGGNPVAVLTRETRASMFARLTLAEERLIMDRTKPLLALALGALALLPVAAAQAATAAPNALSFSSSLGVASAPQTVIYVGPPARVGIDGQTFQSHPFSQTNDGCNSLPASGNGQCAVSVTFTPNIAGATTHATLAFTDGVSIAYASASLTGVAAGNAGGKGKKCHKKGKKASAAKKCKKKKH